MTHNDACKLFIEQEIQEGLKQGKTPYAIGRELAAWIERLVETNIPARTLTKQAERTKQKLATNVANHPTPQSSKQISEKQNNQPVTAQTAPDPGRDARRPSRPCRTTTKPWMIRAMKLWKHKPKEKIGGILATMA